MDPFQLYSFQLDLYSLRLGFSAGPSERSHWRCPATSRVTKRRCNHREATDATCPVHLKDLVYEERRGDRRNHAIISGVTG